MAAYSGLSLNFRLQLLSWPTKKSSLRLGWVGSTRLAENPVAYLRNVLCCPDTCRSLMRERWFTAGPARGSTGHNTTFITKKYGDPKVAARSGHLYGKNNKKHISNVWTIHVFNKKAQLGKLLIGLSSANSCPTQTTSERWLCSRTSHLQPRTSIWQSL